MPPVATADSQRSSDEDSDSSDSSDDHPYPGAEADDSDFDELGADDFPTYFSERDGRLFHSHDSSPYPLPVDTPEQERMNVLHRALFELIGAHHPASCPVRDVLAPHPTRQKYALDMCTGTGKWLIDVARAFPHVAFRGFDIVPIATRYPPENVQFLLHDVNTAAPWEAGTFDLVHTRSVSMAVTSYPAFIAEAARLLRPGGLFISSEWARALYLDPTHAPAAASAGQAPRPAAATPAIAAFFAALHAALAALGLQPTAPPIASLLQAAPALFGTSSIHAETHMVPLGAWHPSPNMRRIGRALRTSFLRYMDSVQPLLSESGGLSPDALAQMYAGTRAEVRSVPGLVAVFHTVHARRV
ncbi:S-adenosyl-L-methionine-dependent methyltransferase [Mycena pura]|uniref:S-adenosyl-L-methionine-dependent methyltransferase n=1 Tax=Mycena pura TaxID=153505 RepID=A0AAD7E2F3_9AGAR|nr:S-adenosyl-L-methionine-dependent methyltransferase [Mycena pura]